jgi:hypothetical protein
MNEEEKQSNNPAPGAEPHQTPEPAPAPAPAPAPSFDANQAAAKTKDTLDKMSNISGWSWGAFMFGPAYLIAVKKYMYLLWYLLMLLPIINFIAMIGLPIYWGLKGTELAKDSTMFKNEDERSGFLRAINHAGFISFLIAIAGIVL